MGTPNIRTDGMQLLRNACDAKPFATSDTNQDTPTATLAKGPAQEDHRAVQVIAEAEQLEVLAIRFH
eukprot:8020808-Pyramimonas_sp.AAC.1